MKYQLIALVWLCSICSVNLNAVDIVLNTQLDKKLKSISKKEVSTEKQLNFNILRKITIHGLETISEEMVRTEISVFIGDNLDPFTINRNLKRIEALGYFDNVSSELQPYEGGKNWIITVKENPVITAVLFSGNESIKSDALMSEISSEVGKMFNYTTVREDIKKIEDRYDKDGYIFVKVKKIDMPTYDKPELTFTIEESQYDQIGVSGNTKTKEYVILRETDIESGDKINREELKKNLGRIFNLNYFASVEPGIVPSTATKNAYNLIYNIEEKSTDSINFGGGWGQRSGGFLYSDLNINNLLGTGQLIALKGQWGSSLQTYQFKYHSPWMFGKRKSLTYRAWNTRGNVGFSNLTTSGYRPEVRYGMDIAIGLPHSYSLRSIHKVKVEEIEVFESDDSDASEYSIQSYAYTLAYDTRDVRFNPLNGAYYFATVENGFSLRSDSLGFTKYDASFSNFFQTFESQTIATRFVVGRINGNVEDTEYYYIGGPNTVRGYVEYPYSFAYGRAQLFTNIEYRFLLSDMFQLLFFADAGWASSLGSDITSGKVGKGFGLRINSPLGPIRLDFGIDELGDMRTHFNIGHVF